MRQCFYFLVSWLLLSACGSAPSMVSMILDTDLDPDCDDVGAMALMHCLADSGEVRILATISSNADERVVPGIEVINGLKFRI